MVQDCAATATAPGLARRLSAVDTDRVVLQVVGGADPEALGALGAALAPLRRGGLRLAVSGAGTRAAGAEHLLALEPDLVGRTRGWWRGWRSSATGRRCCTAWWPPRGAPAPG